MPNSPLTLPYKGFYLLTWDGKTRTMFDDECGRWRWSMFYNVHITGSLPSCHTNKGTVASRIITTRETPLPVRSMCSSSAGQLLCRAAIHNSQGVGSRACSPSVSAQSCFLDFFQSLARTIIISRFLPSAIAPIDRL
jgi:hypothetical protein